MTNLKQTRIFLSSAVVVVMALMLCGNSDGSEKKGQQTPATAKTTKAANDQQLAEKKSYEIFEKILELTQTADDDPKSFEKMEKLYIEIMDKYPTTELAEECHWHLVKMYIGANTQAAYQKARKIYQQFQKRYPKSPLATQIEQELYRTPLHSGAGH